MSRLRSSVSRFLRHGAHLRCLLWLGASLRASWPPRYCTTILAVALISLIWVKPLPRPVRGWRDNGTHTPTGGVMKKAALSFGLLIGYSLAGPAWAADAATIDWSRVPSRTLTLFYPGQSSFQWLRSAAHP